MRGQWIGNYEGYAPGHITLAVDELDSHFAGSFILHPTQDLPVTTGRFSTQDKESAGTIENIPVRHLHPITYEVLSKEQIELGWPTAFLPAKTTADYSFTAENLTIIWKNELGSGSVTLVGSAAKKPSDYASCTMSWNEFKNHVDRLPYRKFVFRGQEKPWRLQTSFHRSGRADLDRYRDEDMAELYKALAGQTRHPYNPAVPEHNGALLHLAQHHGYPTPLLDFTYSPYVAAFFAFRRVHNKSEGTSRIFVFNYGAWITDFQPFLAISSPKLHISILDAMSFDNERAGPQQSLSLVTNIDDIESYLAFWEKRTTKSYLHMIDISHAERDAVLTDLARMGISARSMFPGIDGICEELKERRFPDW